MQVANAKTVEPKQEASGGAVYPAFLAGLKNQFQSVVQPSLLASAHTATLLKQRKMEISVSPANHAIAVGERVKRSGFTVEYSSPLPKFQENQLFLTADQALQQSLARWDYRMLPPLSIDQDVLNRRDDLTQVSGVR